MTATTGELVLLCDACLARIRGATSSPTLRERREAVGLSLRDVERATGINRGRLSNIERGLTPHDDEAARLVAVYSSRTTQA